MKREFFILLLMILAIATNAQNPADGLPANIANYTSCNFRLQWQCWEDGCNESIHVVSEPIPFDPNPVWTNNYPYTGQHCAFRICWDASYTGCSGCTDWLSLNSYLKDNCGFSDIIINNLPDCPNNNCCPVPPNTLGSKPGVIGPISGTDYTILCQ